MYSPRNQLVLVKQCWCECLSGCLDPSNKLIFFRSKLIDESKYRTKTSQRALAYLYCYYQEKARSDPGSVLRAIVKQLCLAYAGGLPTQLLSIYNKREEEAHSNGPLDLFESKDLIISLSKGFLQTTIIIDALDECDVKTRTVLFRILRDIAIPANKIKFFVSGRNESDIRDMLFGIPDHYIDVKDSSNDIKLYIKTEIELFCNEKPDLGIDLALKNEIISTLERGAKGM